MPERIRDMLPIARSFGRARSLRASGLRVSTGGLMKDHDATQCCNKIKQSDKLSGKEWNGHERRSFTGLGNLLD